PWPRHVREAQRPDSAPSVPDSGAGGDRRQDHRAGNHQGAPQGRHRQMLWRRHHAQTQTSRQTEGRQEKDAPVRQRRDPAGGIYRCPQNGCGLMPAIVALIDYGSGNLRSAAKALMRAAETSGTRHEVVITADPDRVAESERIVLPGVGAFADCMRGLSAIPGMLSALEETVLRRGTAFLGICVGMQLLAD